MCNGGMSKIKCRWIGGKKGTSELNIYYKSGKSKELLLFIKMVFVSMVSKYPNPRPIYLFKNTTQVTQTYSSRLNHYILTQEEKLNHNLFRFDIVLFEEHSILSFATFVEKNMDFVLVKMQPLIQYSDCSSSSALDFMLGSKYCSRNDRISSFLTGAPT